MFEYIAACGAGMRRRIAPTFGGAISGAHRQAHEVSTRYIFQLMHASCCHKLEIQCDREGLRPLGVQLLPYPMLVGGTTCPFRERNMLGGRVLLPVLPHILAFSFFSQPSLFPPPFAPPLATRSWPSRTRTGGARTVRAAHESPALDFDTVHPSSRSLCPAARLAASSPQGRFAVCRWLHRVALMLSSVSPLLSLALSTTA